MDKVDKFLTLFSEFDLIITENRKTTKKAEFRVTASQAGQSKADLEKALKRLTQEYKRAQRSFKHNKISRQELFDFEWRIFELKEEIRRIEEEDAGK